MKNNMFYLLVLFLIGTLIYNLYKINYGLGFLSDLNQPYIIGLGAGVCALILAFTFKRFYVLKKNLNR